MALRLDLALYDPFADGLGLLDPNRCFLSGQPVEVPAETVPLFADWLQTRYGLADRFLHLLDRSVVTLGELHLPLSPALRPRLTALESAVESASGSSQALRALPDEMLFWWLGKMFYGIFVAELRQQQQPLVRPEYPLAENKYLLRRFQAFFQLLQGLRLPLEYPDYVPGSVFVLEVDASYPAPAFEHDDDLNTLTFSVKLENSVVVGCLFDIGLIKQAMQRVYADVQAVGPLHPAQVAEFKARVYYAAYLLAVVPDLYPRPGQAGEKPVVLDALIDDVTSAVFNPWENLAYAHTLQGLWARWGIAEKQILADPAQPLSLLYDQNQRVRPAAAAADMLTQLVAAATGQQQNEQA